MMDSANSTLLSSLIGDKDKRLLVHQFSHTFPAGECKQFIDFLIAVQKWKEILIASTSEVFARYLYGTSPLNDFLATPVLESLHTHRSSPSFDMFDAAEAALHQQLQDCDFVKSYQKWLAAQGTEPPRVKPQKSLPERPRSASLGGPPLQHHVRKASGGTPRSRPEGEPTIKLSDSTSVTPPTIRKLTPVLGRAKSRPGLTPELKSLTNSSGNESDFSPLRAGKKGDTSSGSQETVSPDIRASKRETHSEGSSQDLDHDLGLKRQGSGFLKKLSLKSRGPLSEDDGHESGKEPKSPSTESTTGTTSSTHRASMSEWSLEAYSGEDFDSHSSSALTPTSSAHKMSAATSGSLKEAHLDELLLYYTYSTPSKVLLQNLMIAHGNFVSSLTLLDSITSLYLSLKDIEPDEALVKQLQLRAVNMVKVWIETLYQSNMAEQPLLLDKTLDLINIISNSDTELGAHVGSIMTRVSEQYSQLKRLPSPKIGVPAPAHLMDLSIPDLAKQLCLMDAKLASDVKLCEFFDSSWTVGKSPGIRKISEFTNTLTYALANDVLSANNKQKRIKTLGRILKLGKHLLEFNNYNSLMAIYLCVHLNCVSRLKVTWKSLPRKYKPLLRQLDLMSPYNNFMSYRTHIKTVRPPVILCTEILLKDLLYQNEGSANFVDKDLQLINLQKLNSMGNIMRHFFTAVKETEYPFPIQQSIYDTLLSIAAPTADELHDKSQACEPD